MKYKLSPVDMKNDIWIIVKKFLWLFWIPYSNAGAGNKGAMLGLLDKLNEKIN